MLKRRRLILAAVLPAFLSTSAAIAADPPRTERTLSVSASASAAAAPDMANYQIGVTTESVSARDALSQNNANMTRLLDGLKKAGIAAQDLRTSGLALFPRYTQKGSSSSPRIDGYQATNTLRVTVRDLAKLGEFLDQSITLGANQIQGIQFEVSQAETLRDEARKQAMVNARRRAELYAAAAGAKVGPVLSISETLTGLTPRRVAVQARASYSEAVPVEPGTQALEATVHVLYALE